MNTSRPAAVTTVARVAPGPAVGVPIAAVRSGGVLAGVLGINSFEVGDAGRLVAQGVFSGTATVDGVTNDVTSPVSVEIADASGSPTVLDLTLGSLRLDPFGLVVDLQNVQLRIAVQVGPASALGDLLCAVAHLLDSRSSSHAVAAVLNRILMSL